MMPNIIWWSLLYWTIITVMIWTIITTMIPLESPTKVHITCKAHNNMNIWLCNLNSIHYITLKWCFIYDAKYYMIVSIILNSHHSHLINHHHNKSWPHHQVLFSYGALNQSHVEWSLLQYHLIKVNSCDEVCEYIVLFNISLFSYNTLYACTYGMR